MKLNYSLLLLLLFIAVATNQAQTISTQKGLTTARFNYSAGTITVYLPEDIRPGDMISGTIKAEATGKNARQLAKNLAQLKSYSIEFDGKRYPVDAAAKLKHNVTNNRSQQRFLNLINSEGVNAGEVSVPCLTGPPKREPGGCSIPSHALTGDPLRIPGPFDGNSSNTQCKIDGQAMDILAESPRQCIIYFPSGGNQLRDVKVNENEKQNCSKIVSAVDMQVTTGRLNLRRGERTFIKVGITGLKNLPDTVSLTLSNMSADIVELQPSNRFTIPIIPDSVVNGDYEQSFDVQSIKPGSFIVNVDLDLPQPPVYASVRTGVEPPVVYADNNGIDVGGIKLHPLKVDGLKNGMSDAFKKAVIEITGNRSSKYPELDGCGSCLTCIQSMLDEGKVALVGEIGNILMEHYVDLLVGKTGGALAWIKDKFDKLEKAGDIADAIADAVKKGEIQVVEFPEKMCDYCLVSAIGFYDAKTQCMDAFFYCKGSKMCCTHALTIIHLKYCVNEDGYKKPGTGLDIDVISK